MRSLNSANISGDMSIEGERVKLPFMYSNTPAWGEERKEEEEEEEKEKEEEEEEEMKRRE